MPRDSKGMTLCKIRCLWCKKITDGQIHFENSLLVKVATNCLKCGNQEMVF